MVTLGLFDWVIWLTYFTLIFVILFFYRHKKSTSEYRYFLPGVLIKVFGGVLFVLIYIYYYGFGDTFLYHNGASILVDTFWDDPGTYFQLLISDSGNLPPNLQQFAQSIPYSRTSEEWFMVKILSPINLISFKSYLVVTLFTSLISFVGSWKLFRVFNDIFKDKSKLSFIAAFLIPSAFFWGSGVLKDSITLAAFNIFIFHLYFGISQGKLGIWRLIALVICVSLIFILKSYIILAFLPSLGIILYLVFQSKIKSPVIRFASGPVILAVIGFFFYSALISLSETSEKYSIESLETQAKGFHSWHTTTAGSAYNLGEIEYTAFGVLTKIPAGLNVTFFRPYLWESNNVVMFISALESLTLLLLLLWGIIKWRSRIFKSISANPFLIGFLAYCIIFGFAVGFTSYNFGALMRYKIPISSLSFFILFFLVFHMKNTSNE
ncbi:MAG: hypothetical protein R2780_01325 [Crocinitomicaceae bacterium]|nr:hypothetical protein [Crocinitomicaceae bacterium]